MRASVVGFAVLFAAAAVGAAEHPCKEDAERLCKGVEPGQGRIVQCLKQHEAELSPACKQRRDSFRERMQEIHAACQEDAQKYCAGVQPGGGRIARCLEQHQADLSEACRSEGQKISEERGAHRELLQQAQQSCRADAQKFCAGVQPGAGRIANCLRSHKSALSQDCTAAIEQAKDRR
jgi:Golgi apparatus protein 1